MKQSKKNKIMFKKVAVLVVLVFASCTDNVSKCEEERAEVRNYFENLIEEVKLKNGYSSNGLVDRIYKDMHTNLDKISCD